MVDGARELSGEAAAADPARRRRRWLWVALKVIFGLGIVVFLLSSDHIRITELYRYQRPIDFLCAQLVWYVGFHLTVLRWRLILGALDVPARYRDAARLCWVGLLFSQVIPGATGGDVVKGFQIARESPGRRPQAVLSVVLDRAIGLTALMLIGVVGVLLCPDEVRGDPVLQKLGFALVGMITLVLLGGALLCWRGFWQREWMVRTIRRIPGHRVIGQLAQALWAVRGRRRILGVAMLLSIAAHGFFVGTVFLLARGLTGESPSILNYLFLVPIGQLAFSLPTTPGGLGVGQVAYLKLFEQVGERHGAELGVLIQLTAVLWSLVGMVMLLRGGRRTAEQWTAVVADQVAGAHPGAGESPESAEDADSGSPCRSGGESLSSSVPPGWDGAVRVPEERG